MQKKKKKNLNTNSSEKKIYIEKRLHDHLACSQNKMSVYEQAQAVSEIHRVSHENIDCVFIYKPTYYFQSCIVRSM